MISDTLNDKINGLFIGGALGDAIGAPHEFSWSSVAYTGKLEHCCARHIPFKMNINKYDLGQITDDTEMLLCIMNSLIYNKGLYIAADVLTNYICWANQKTNKVIGRNTKKLFHGITTLKGYEKRYKDLFNTQEKKDSQLSNGALMRSGIFAIYGLFNDDYENAIITDCSLTNPGAITIDTNLIFIKTIIYILKNNVIDKEDILAYAMNLATLSKQPKIITRLNHVKNKINENITHEKGYCLHALYCAFFGLIHFDSYKSAIDYIIKLGGDTDTNACIAGYLLGAYYGIADMQKNLITQNNISVLLNCTTKNGDYERPTEFVLLDYCDKIKYLLNIYEN